MRFGSCINCVMTEEQQQLLAEERHQQSALAALAEMHSDCHHHHVVRCASCGSWWFDDTVTGGPGIPEPARRDTMICGCPEDGYSRTIVMAPTPESECRCTAADAAGYIEPDRMPGGWVRAVRVCWRGRPSPEVSA